MLVQISFALREKFELFKINGFPRRTDDGLFYLPEIGNVFLGLGNDHFFEMPNTKDCIDIKLAKLKVCKPALLKSNDVPSCMKSFFYNNTLSTCKWNQALNKQTFFIGNNETFWFIMLKEKTTLNIRCKNKEVFKELSGAIAIDRSCLVKSNLFVLNTPRFSKSYHSVTGNWIFKKLNVSVMIKPNVSYKDSALEQLGTALENLNRSTSVDLRKVIDMSNQAWNVQSIHFSMSLAGVLFVMVFAGITIYCLRRNKHKPPTEVQMEVIMKNLVERLESVK